MSNLPDNLPSILRAAGLTVVEVDGWRTRGRPASTGGFDPVGCLVHHTATSRASSDEAVVRLLVGGRSDLPGPLCHLGLARDGTVYVIAAGRANHAGEARSSGSVAAGDGNSLYIGIEAFNDGRGEPWPAVQYDAYVLLAAVLSVKVTGNSVNTVRGHKETSVTGKVDPLFDMDGFRRRVAATMDQLRKPKRGTKATRVGLCNVKASRSGPVVRDALRAYGKRHRLHVILGQEGNNVRAHLENVPGWRLVAWHPSGTFVLVRWWVRTKRRGTDTLSGRTWTFRGRKHPGRGIAWAIARGIRFVSAHEVPNVDFPLDAKPKNRAAARKADAVAFVNWAQSRPRTPMLRAGDNNTRAAERADHSPRWQARKTGMRVWDTGRVDYPMGRDVTVTDLTESPMWEGGPGADHHWQHFTVTPTTKES